MARRDMNYLQRGRDVGLKPIPGQEPNHFARQRRSMKEKDKDRKRVRGKINTGIGGALYKSLTGKDL